MGYRELLLLSGAIALFGLMSATINRNILDQNESMFLRESENYALAAAQSLINEAKTKSFDHNVLHGTPPFPENFTPSGILGPEAGETYPGFDDVDDFHEFSSTDSTRIGDYSAAIEVGYVAEDDPDQTTGSKTIFKKMTVTVSSAYLDEPVQASYIFTYLEQ